MHVSYFLCLYVWMCELTDGCCSTRIRLEEGKGEFIFILFFTGRKWTVTAGRRQHCWKGKRGLVRAFMRIRIIWSIKLTGCIYEHHSKIGCKCQSSGRTETCHHRKVVMAWKWKCGYSQQFSLPSAQFVSYNLVQEQNFQIYRILQNHVLYENWILNHFVSQEIARVVFWNRPPCLPVHCSRSFYPVFWWYKASAVDTTA